MTKPNGWTGVRWLYRAKSDSVHTPSDTHPYGDQVFRFHVGYNDEEGPSESVIALILAAPSLYEALAAVVDDCTYETADGASNCRFCDNLMDHEGTHRDMHDADCLVHKARAALSAAEGGA